MISECLVVEFAVSGDDCPLAEATRDLPVAIDAQPPQLRADGNALLGFSAPLENGVAARLDADERIRYLHRSRVDGRANYRCLSTHPCVVHELVDVGLLVDSITYREGGARIVGAVVGREVLEGVLSRAGDTVGVQLRRVYPLGEEDETPVAQRWNLTPKQTVAMETALRMGYYAVPRAVEASAVADELGISKSAFVERLRRGERALLEQVFG